MTLALAGCAPTEPPPAASDQPYVREWRPHNGVRLTPVEAGQFVALRAPLNDMPEDLQVSARFEKLGGPPGGGYGVIVRDQGASAGDGRDQGGQYVAAVVGDKGQIGIWLRDGMRWVDLLPWKPSPVVHAGAAANELTVETKGSRLRMIVNGAQVADVDTGLSAGRVGVFAGGDGNDVLLERFHVQGLATTTGTGARASAQAPASAGSDLAPRPGASAFPWLPVNGRVSGAALDRMRALLAGIADEMLAIFALFADGIDGPHSPVNDRTSLDSASRHLEAARSHADALLTELRGLQVQEQPNGR